MPYSEYNRALKCAVMLEAKEGLAFINYANFGDFEKKSREDIQRNLKEASEFYLFKPLLDYKDVVANLARKLKGGRR